jgi:hypothetical protein
MRAFCTGTAVWVALAAGADSSAKNNAGETPWTYVDMEGLGEYRSPQERERLKAALQGERR